MHDQREDGYDVEVFVTDRIQWDKLRESVSAEVAAMNPGLFTKPPIADAKEFYAHDTKGDVASEKELQRKCEHYLSSRNIWYMHLSHRAREQAGIPDLVFANDGKCYGIELKSAHGVLSDEQKHTLEHMAACGWKTAVCRSYQEFMEAIK